MWSGTRGRSLLRLDHVLQNRANARGHKEAPPFSLGLHLCAPTT